MTQPKQKDFKTLVTGGSGMVGHALQALYPSATFVGTKDADLKDLNQTRRLFEQFKPRYVIHLAAKVGGVKGNSDYVADFYADNALINTNVLKCAVDFDVKRVVSMLSTCVYPDKDYVTYPLTEDQMHNGPPHESNYGYAHAKRMLEVQTRAINKQHGKNYICAIPNNIYGKHDNFDLDNGHVIPSLIRKIWEAKHNLQNVVLWGDGSPLREFTEASDIARAILFLLWTVKTEHTMVNIGCTQEHSIKEVAEKIAHELGYHGQIIWDTNMPVGQLRKPSSNQRFVDLGFDPVTYRVIDGGLKETCAWFKNNYPYVRGAEGYRG